MADLPEDPGIQDRARRNHDLVVERKADHVHEEPVARANRGSGSRVGRAIGNPVECAERLVDDRRPVRSDELQMDHGRRETERGRDDLKRPVRAIGRLAHRDTHDLRPAARRRDETGDHNVQDCREDHRDGYEQYCRDDMGGRVAVPSEEWAHVEPLGSRPIRRTSFKPSFARIKRGTLAPPGPNYFRYRSMPTIPNPTRTIVTA